MGFKINVNNILRYETSTPLEEGKEYPFEKDELSILADDIQIWLTKKDWTALAEIQVVSQTRKNHWNFHCEAYLRNRRIKIPHRYFPKNVWMEIE